MSTNSIAEIIEQINKFFTTFGNIGGLSILFFVSFIYFGYRYLNFRIKQSENRLYLDLDEERKKNENLLKQISDTELGYELKIKDIINLEVIHSFSHVSIG